MTTKAETILYLPMEIASRELDSRLLLASLAVSRGYEVVLGQKWLIERNIDAMPPGLYLSKTLTARDGVAMAEAKRCGYVVAAIDEELPGLSISANQLRWMSPLAVDAADLIFIAGRGNAAAMEERFPAAAQRIIQAANPRWDLLRSDLSLYYRKEVEQLHQRYGRFILINTNLGFTNSEKGSTDQIIQEQERLGKLDLRNPEHLDYVKSIVDMETENRLAIEQLLNDLPERFPDHRIILRPHPSESLDTWHKIAGDRKRIDVLREGAAVAWICASDLLIHTNCTTGVEALALNKPAICLMPSDSRANGRYLSNRVNPVTRTIAETLNLVGTILVDRHETNVNGTPYTEAMRHEFKTAMSYDALKLGAETILDKIEQFIPTGVAVNSPRKQSIWSPSWRYRWKLQDKNVRGRLMPDLDAGDITERLGRFGELLQVRPPMTVTDIGSKVLLLSNKTLAQTTLMRRSLGRLL